MDFLIFILLLSFVTAGSLRLFRKMRFAFGNQLEEAVFSAALGLGLLAYGVLMTGLLRLLAAGIWWFLLTLGLWIFRREIGSLLQISLNSLYQELSFKKGVFRTLSFYFFLLFSALIGFLTFLPPVGGDPLCYHLGLPKIFVEKKAVIFIPFTANSVFPFLTEMLYGLGLLLNGSALAQMFQWGLGLIAATGVCLLASRFLAASLFWLPGIIFLLTPGIFHQMPTAGNDIAMTLYVFMGFWALYEAVLRDEKKWYALSGVFLGFALSVKLVSALYVASCGIWLLLTKRKTPVHSLVSSALVWTGFILLFCFVWYLRSYWHLGNPVYPYFSVGDKTVEVGYDLAKHGMGKSLKDFILSFWNLTLYPESFGGRGNQLGPIFLSFLPSILILQKRIKGFFEILLFGGFGFCLWFLGPQNLRFLFPLVPIFCVGITPPVFNLDRGNSKTILSICLRIIFLSFLLISTMIFFEYFIPLTPYIFTNKKRQEFLRAYERSYPIAQLVNQKTKKTDKILSQEIRIFYFEPEIIREDMFRRQTDYLRRFKSLEERLNFLKGKGISHLLVIHDASFGLSGYLRELGFEEGATSGFLNLVGETETSYDGKTLYYQLFKVQ